MASMGRSFTSSGVGGHSLMGKVSQRPNRSPRQIGSEVNPWARRVAKTPRTRIGSYHFAPARPTENAPPGEARRFWGYYREERYVSLYMWIRGR
jgi:hypothetical protein